MATVFNHVSKNENFNHTLETIDKYKTLLTSESIEFYTDFISDDTKISGQKWKDFKKSVMGSIYYKKEPWFNELHRYEKRILESLIFA